MTVIIDGRACAEKILENIKTKTSKLNKKPGLSVILVGENPASKVYVKNKEKKAIEAGFNSYVYRLPENTSKAELLSLIDKLNNEDNTDCILLQLPLPKHLNPSDFLDKIDPKKDVDGFHPINSGKLLNNEKPYAIPCTPKGIIRLLDEYNIEIAGKNAVVIGRSNIVGKPVSMLLLNKNATVTIAHSKTKNLIDVVKQADIIVSATGISNIITKNMVKEGAAVIDVGIIRGEDGKLKGDVDFNNIKDIAGFITPVPGGVGPMTIAMLMENTLELHLLRNNLC
ncbi:MAG: bifunctional methylenetetrahydrofolate dehydrogenase/methenyltetrahydrofolate cyclohydrolase FolD [Candidatus Gastranaerophilales bacterium]|nr:bifunctional methylenetetrahydrofolate dehydrogenase/methenyltetrahydrofolate cyclohydrolase FolD [Candidatus Gastranaerophilales bacterium]